MGLKTSGFEDFWVPYFLMSRKISSNVNNLAPFALDLSVLVNITEMSETF